LPPIVWCVEFKPNISSQVVSDKNPWGCLTNLDLELAAVLLHYMVLQQEVDMQFKRVGVLSDNRPTVAWTKRMADKSQSPTAGQLLRGLAAIQRETQSGPLTVVAGAPLPGVTTKWLTLPPAASISCGMPRSSPTSHPFSPSHSRNPGHLCPLCPN
jgi:hypothetical protein